MTSHFRTLLQGSKWSPFFKDRDDPTTLTLQRIAPVKAKIQHFHQVSTQHTPEVEIELHRETVQTRIPLAFPLAMPCRATKPAQRAKKQKCWTTKHCKWHPHNVCRKQGKVKIRQHTTDTLHIRMRQIIPITQCRNPLIHRMLPLQSDKIGGGGLTMLHPRSPHSSILSLRLTNLPQFSGTTQDTILESTQALRWLTNLTRMSQQQQRQAALFIQYLMGSPFILDLPPFCQRGKTCLPQLPGSPERWNLGSILGLWKDRNIRLPQSQTMHHDTRDICGQNNPTMVREGTGNDMAWRHQRDPRQREAHQVDTGRKRSVWPEPRERSTSKVQETPHIHNMAGIKKTR